METQGESAGAGEMLPSTTEIMPLLALPPAGPAESARMSSADLRHHYLAENLFSPGQLQLASFAYDRILFGGAVPTTPLPLPSVPELASSFFLERREAALVNLGAPATVHAAGVSYPLNSRDALYLGLGVEHVEIASAGPEPALVYLFSCPAHRAYPTALVTADQAIATPLGAQETASRRTIRKYICPDTVPSCQLTLGITDLEPGSIWNTWPPHTHARRSEVYLYFNLGDIPLAHFMGEPANTRHLFVRNLQAVASPPWSIHSGAGASNYSFVWAMAGENQAFSDMDAVPAAQLG